MARHFTAEEQAQWLKSQPRKPISSKVVLLDETGKLFFTKPSYKPGWGFVGGMVDENESPLQAAIRETGEETGLHLAAERFVFLGARYGVSKNSGNDYIHFLFAVRLREGEEDGISLQTEEIDDGRWLSFEDADGAIDIKDHTWKLAKRILHSKQAAYADNDETIIASTLSELDLE